MTSESRLQVPAVDAGLSGELDDLRRAMLLLQAVRVEVAGLPSVWMVVNHAHAHLDRQLGKLLGVR